MKTEIDWSDPCLKRWLGGTVNKNTLYNSKAAFRLYSQFTGMTATELIDESIEDFKRDPRERKDIVLQKLIKFYWWLQDVYRKKKADGKGKIKETDKGLSPLSAEMRVNVIRGFYSTFDIIVRFKGKHKLPKARVENPRIVFKPEDVWKVKALVDHACNKRDRAVVLFHFQGGLDVSTLCSLNYGDVKEGLDKKEHPLKIEPMRVKTGVEFYTFVGQDAIDAVNAYIDGRKRRGVKFDNKTPLFQLERGKKRLKPHNIQVMMKELAVCSGLVTEKNNGNAFNPLGTHSLRESFGSLMINSGVPDTIVDFWLGHEIGDMAKAYKTTQFESLKKMYAEREHLLSITSPKADEQTKAEVKEVKNDLYSLHAENAALKNKVSKLNSKFDERIADLYRRHDRLMYIMNKIAENPKGGAIIQQAVADLRDEEDIKAQIAYANEDVPDVVIDEEKMKKAKADFEKATGKKVKDAAKADEK